MLKKGIMIFLIIALSVLISRHFVKMMDSDIYSETSLGSFKICDSEYSIRLYKTTVQPDMSVPVVYEIRYNDSIIRNRKLLITTNHPHLTSEYFKAECADNMFQLSYAADRDTLVPVLSYDLSKDI